MDVDLSPAVESELRKRWTEPHRHHHNQRHLDEVLGALRTLRESGCVFDHRPVVLAAWFHDAIYRPFSSRNEHASAELARTLLAADPDGDEVARLVEMTTDHMPAPDDHNGIALSDADLSVLGAEPDRYAEYVDGVRAEFHRVPGFLYRRRRRAMLTEFLAREHIFVSDPARILWEEPARANISREISTL